MEKKRKISSKKNLKKKAIGHFKNDIEYYKKEAEQDKRNISAIKKSKSIPKKRLKKHLKGDMKGFKEEIREDKELINELRGKNGSSKSNTRTKSKRAKKR